MICFISLLDPIVSFADPKNQLINAAYPTSLYLTSVNKGSRQQLIALTTSIASLHEPHDAANDSRSTEHGSDHNHRHDCFVRVAGRASVRALALAHTAHIALASAAARLFCNAISRARYVVVIGLTHARAVVLIAGTVHAVGRRTDHFALRTERIGLAHTRAVSRVASAVLAGLVAAVRVALGPVVAVIAHTAAFPRTTAVHAPRTRTLHLAVHAVVVLVTRAATRELIASAVRATRVLIAVDSASRAVVVVFACALTRGGVAGAVRGTSRTTLELTFVTVVLGIAHTSRG